MELDSQKLDAIDDQLLALNETDVDQRWDQFMTEAYGIIEELEKDFATNHTIYLEPAGAEEALAPFYDSRLKIALRKFCHHLKELADLLLTRQNAILNEMQEDADVMEQEIGANIFELVSIMRGAAAMPQDEEVEALRELFENSVDEALED